MARVRKALGTLKHAVAAGGLVLGCSPAPPASLTDGSFFAPPSPFAAAGSTNDEIERVVKEYKDQRAKEGDEREVPNHARKAGRCRALRVGKRLNRLWPAFKPQTAYYPSKKKRGPKAHQNAAKTAMFDALQAKDAAAFQGAKNRAAPKKMMRFARLVDEFPMLKYLDVSWSDITKTLLQLEAGGGLHDLLKACRTR